ncbi:sushi, von Willebrand factor type A, EGF and pentraxin domain-containing protein 1-like [Corticium candelabrum]|uniref:sushi, von Willebrand factor type A, EGF and pentraxin domain-containing protein 1-like n=1 Tax=Corticium candelabrum TaxID=121492 RepID=UPI002E266624|nr:sushi, von Willebrand factor type A, EGF and pentraxin domain-containing protein 1-like [Corticium candelabrum]
MSRSSKHFPVLLVLLLFMVTYTAGWGRRRRSLPRPPPPPAPPPHCSSCSHGKCVGNPGYCSCDSGWYGGDCSHPQCSSGCYNGKCTNPNRCSCSEGWSGSTCRTSVCSQGCSQGTCIAPNYCRCSSGWSGRACNSPLCTGGCLNGGTCQYPNTCTCLTEFTGPNCEVRLCNNFEAPANGSAECKVDLITSRYLCDVGCRVGYAFPVEQQPSSLQICDKEGRFTQETANKEIPDCTEKGPVDLAINLTVQSNFPVACNETSQFDWEEIKRNALEAISYRFCLSADGCKDLVTSLIDYKCHPEENVVSQECPYQQQTPTAATDTPKMIITLIFQVFVNTNVSGSSLGTEDLFVFEKRLENAFESTSRTVSEQPISIRLTRLETTVDIVSESIQSSKIEMKCKEGEILVNSSCLICSRGTFYNNVTHVCEPCPLATYQEMEGQNYCSRCSEGLTTRLTGTKSSNGCKSLCPPGFYSSNGYQPCTQCPDPGTQSRAGQTSCV